MDGFGQAAYDLAESALSLLPGSPFAFLSGMSNSPIAQYLAVLNWFIPIATFIAIFESWCIAILTYYVIQIGLRWAKAIE